MKSDAKKSSSERFPRLWKCAVVLMILAIGCLAAFLAGVIYLSSWLFCGAVALGGLICFGLGWIIFAWIGDMTQILNER